jgi:hypothetical protein
MTSEPSLLKERPPRQAYVQWLLDNKRVRIDQERYSRVGSGPNSVRDYFQEYRILDSEKPRSAALARALSTTTRLDAPLGAVHRRPPEDCRSRICRQFTAERRQALTTLAPVDYVLRRVSDPAMFFAPRTDALMPVGGRTDNCARLSGPATPRATACSAASIAGSGTAAKPSTRPARRSRGVWNPATSNCSGH